MPKGDIQVIHIILPFNPLPLPSRPSPIDTFSLVPLSLVHSLNAGI